MPTTLEPEIRRLIDGSNFAALSTLMPDGSPKVESVWVGREDDCILIATDSRGIKGQNLAKDPRVALSISDFDNPYDQALIRGRVVETREDNDLVVLDALSEKYLSKPFPRRKWSSRVVYVVEADLARHAKSPLTHTPANRATGGPT